MCLWLGFFANRAATKVANIMSSLVSIIENDIETVTPCYLSFSAVMAWSSMQSCRIADFFIEVVAVYILSRWNLRKTLAMKAGWENLIVCFFRFY